MGTVSQLLAKHNVQVRRGAAVNHRQQGIVERFNRTLAERLFGQQYAQELLLTARGASERSSEWVRALPDVVAALNDEVTRLTVKKPSEVIKASVVAHKPSLPARRVVGHDEPLLPSDAVVRYLYAPGELEGGRRRATDPVWSLATTLFGMWSSEVASPLCTTSIALPSRLLAGSFAKSCLLFHTALNYHLIRFFDVLDRYCVYSIR